MHADVLYQHFGQLPLGSFRRFNEHFLFDHLRLMRRLLPKEPKEHSSHCTFTLWQASRSYDKMTGTLVRQFVNFGVIVTPANATVKIGVLLYLLGCFFSKHRKKLSFVMQFLFKTWRWSPWGLKTLTCIVCTCCRTSDILRLLRVIVFEGALSSFSFSFFKFFFRLLLFLSSCIGLLLLLLRLLFLLLPSPGNNTAQQGRCGYWVQPWYDQNGFPGR